MSDTFDDMITLLSDKAITYDEYGNAIESSSENNVFCNRKSVGRNEFYSAGASGFKLSYIFTMNDFEYMGEDKIMYLGKVYSVIKTYDLDKGLIELTVGEKIGN